MIKKLQHSMRVLIIFCSAVTLLCLFFPAQAHATSSFGSGTYGSCTYESCPDSTTQPGGSSSTNAPNSSDTGSPAPQTIVRLPTGLEVAINLYDGQVIPLSGYTIIITPLNGKNSSFQTATISINSIVVGTVKPASNGTAEWRWSPQSASTKTVAIAITGNDNQTEKRTFQVTVSAGLAAYSTQNTVPPVRYVPRSIQHFIHSLSKPVTYGIPYTLFALLAVDAGLLFLQTEREIRELKTIQKLSATNHLISESKETFIALASHYLRTPLTILSGGVDMLTEGQSTPFRPLLKSLHDKSESLITDIHLGSENEAESNRHEEGNLRLWLRPALILPILLIGLISFIFDYLANHIGTYTIGHTANLLQLGEFLLCSVILYEVFRWHYLKRQDTQLAQSELARELHIAEVRTAFVKQVLLTLRDDIESCKHLKNSLEPSDTTELIQEGLMRLNAMIAKFEVALELKERGSVTESKRVQLADLLSAALKPLEPQIKEKKLTIQQTSCELRTQSPPLLTYVLRSIVDNAISYSQPNNSIAISSRLTDHETRVAIEDHGSGIPQDRLSILFQPFSKAEGAETFDHEGMGFDLYLDKIIADYLNGKISITSEPKKGTRVELAFPS